MRSEELQRERTENMSQNIFELVHEDLSKREAKGAGTYGGTLMADDGRDMLQEAYEEALDLAVYLRCEIEKRDQLWLSLAGEPA